MQKKALTLHLARSEGYERYFGCNLMPWCITLDNSKGISRLRFWAKNSRVNGINDLPVFMHQGTKVVHWYNTQRLLEPIGNVPPVEYEMNYYRSQEGSLEMARLN